MPYLQLAIQKEEAPCNGKHGAGNGNHTPQKAAEKDYGVAAKRTETRADIRYQTVGGL
ncbi:hypothetical protein HYS48_04795 [Candidatus Woesearchaeota archaeon]|nr:hypothetical protein [Candidatus Woesearchaeota archaeon]